MLYGALLRGRGKVNEADIYRLMTQRIAAGRRARAPIPRQNRGTPRSVREQPRSSAERTRSIERCWRSSRRVDASGRARALDEAVERYLSRPEVALPDVPKDMTILYDHPYTSFVVEGFNARRMQPYPNLTGFVWASHWFQLAVQEPLEVSADSAERLEGLKIVTERFQRKLY